MKGPTDTDYINTPLSLLSRKNSDIILLLLFVAITWLTSPILSPNQLPSPLWSYFIGIMFLCYLLVLFKAWFLYRKGLIAIDALTVLLMLGGYLIKMTLTVFFDVYSFSHDAGKIFPLGVGGGEGHINYILYLFEHGHLPDFDPRTRWAFFNPPLHHILGSLWFRLNYLLGISWNIIAENLQIMTMFYSSMCIIVSRRIIRELDIPDEYGVYLVTFLSYFPAFNYLALNVNNDALATLLATCSILFGLYWARTPDIKNILLLSCSVGLGILTKMSNALVIPAILVVFVYRFVTRGELRTRIASHILGFFLIVFIVGGAFPLRNYLIYKISPTYIPDLGTTSDQYIGNYSYISRLGLPRVRDILALEKRWGVVGIDHNVWLETTRSALFDERKLLFSSTVMGKLWNGQQAMTFLFILLSMLFLFFTLIGFYRRRTLKDSFLVIYLTTLVFAFIKFNLQYPQLCSANFRYIIPSIVVLFVLVLPREGGSRSLISRLYIHIFMVFVSYSSILSATSFYIFQVPH